MLQKGSPSDMLQKIINYKSKLNLKFVLIQWMTLHEDTDLKYFRSKLEFTNFNSHAVGMAVARPLGF